jgi:hypothetical protein
VEPMYHDCNGSADRHQQPELSIKGGAKKSLYSHEIVIKKKAA